TGETATDDDHRRVDEAHQPGQHSTDPPAAVANELDAGHVALGGAVGDVLRGHRAVGGEPLGEGGRGAGTRGQQRVPGQRRAAEQRLQATRVAACADRAVRIGLDVANVAGTPVGTAVRLAVEIDAATDPRTDLDEEQVVGGPGHAAEALPHGHDVHVVVHHDRTAVLPRQHVAHRVAVPARHDRR